MHRKISQLNLALEAAAHKVNLHMLKANRYIFLHYSKRTAVFSSNKLNILCSHLQMQFHTAVAGTVPGFLLSGIY